MGLHVQDLQRPSEQNRNAGNGGDIVKHSVYLALLDALRGRNHPWSGELHVVEAHAGKGVYVVPATREYAKTVKHDQAMRRSKLCAAQERAFMQAPDGLGAIEGMRNGELSYAASAVLHAFVLRSVPTKSLLVLDCDSHVTATLTRVFDQPAFRGLRPPPRVLCPNSSSEELILDWFQRGCFGGHHVVHLDPFAFVTSKKHAQERTRYAELLRTADRRVASKTLAALSIFVVWGQRHGSKAKADLYGAGRGETGGYHDLYARIGSERRIAVKWCWGQHFAMLLVVPPEIRNDVVERINDYCEPLPRGVEVSGG